MYDSWLLPSSLTPSHVDPFRRIAIVPQASVRELAGNADVDDATLVWRACDGDCGAEEALYHRHVDYALAW